MEYWTALTIGALGSFHCVGMCGPIALALPLGRTNKSSKFLGSGTYNLGRVLTYAALGAFLGAMGQALGFMGAQQWLSIALGILILLSVLLPATLKNRFSPESYISRSVGKVKASMGALFRQQGLKPLFLIGLLNGLLPCGLVYLALAGAIATGNSISGSIYMALFGLGTIPIMLGLSLLGNMISLRARNNIRKAIPVFVAIMGIMFIVRGMDLGIPYLSPKVTPQHFMECCH